MRRLPFGSKKKISSGMAGVKEVPLGQEKSSDLKKNLNVGFVTSSFGTGSRHFSSSRPQEFRQSCTNGK